MHFTAPILFVEENSDDIALFRRAFDKLGVKTNITVVNSGEEAVEMLKAKGKFADREQYPFPNVIFMSLRAPERGFQVLEWLRSHPECNVIPVILFSSMQRDSDVKKAFALGIHGFFEKPNSPEDLQQNLEKILDYWNISAKPQVPTHC